VSIDTPIIHINPPLLGLPSNLRVFEFEDSSRKNYSKLQIFRLDCQLNQIFSGVVGSIRVYTFPFLFSHIPFYMTAGGNILTSAALNK